MKKLTTDEELREGQKKERDKRFDEQIHEQID